MNLNRTNMLLAVFLAAIVVIIGATRVDYTVPNIEILPDMKYTPAWTAYAPNPAFANGRTLQAPVPGTAARGQKPFHYNASKEDAVRAGEELKSPYDPAHKQYAKELQLSVQRGGDAYRIFCVSCHGATGGGDGPVAKRGFPPPPHLLTGKSVQMKDGQLFHILSRGQGSMPDFAAQIPPDLRWDLVNYVRNMQSKAAKKKAKEAAGSAPKSVELPPSTPPDNPPDNPTDNPTANPTDSTKDETP